MKKLKIAAAALGVAATITMSSAIAQNTGILLPIQITNASGNLADMGKAADGNPNTSWNSGGPPTQWIDIDLGSDRLFSKLRMLPEMSNWGQVVHNIYGRTSAGEWHFFGTSGSVGQNNLWIEYFSPREIPVRYLVIQTTTSPSWVAWREFQVYDGGYAESTCTPNFVHGMALYRVGKDECGIGVHRYHFRNIFNLPIGSIVNTCTTANLINIPRLEFLRYESNSGRCYGYNGDTLHVMQYK